MNNIVDVQYAEGTVGHFFVPLVQKSGCLRGLQENLETSRNIKAGLGCNFYNEARWGLSYRLLFPEIDSLSCRGIFFVK